MAPLPPVAFFLFNRPQQTQAVFDVIRRVKPAELFLCADGPRAPRADDLSLCDQVRRIVEGVDWPCIVHRNYSATNLGCGNRLSSGINWVFSHAERAIILEDDCLPDPSFFVYCQELLERYADEPRILSISGYRSDGPDEPEGESYFVSRYPAIWGWATWKRSWNLFDRSLSAWLLLKSTPWLQDLLGDPMAESYWTHTFDQAPDDRDNWDHAWVFSHWLHGGFSIRPKVNMIRNLGFTPDGTHTHQLDATYWAAARAAAVMPFPLRHPRQLACDPETERRIEWVSHSGMWRRALAEARRRIQEQRR